MNHLRLLPLLLVPFLASCINQGEVRNLDARLTQNEQRVQELSRQIPNVADILPGQAESWAQLQSMRQELNMLRGQLDEISSGGGGGQYSRLSATVSRLEAAVRQMAAQLGVQLDILDRPLDVAPPTAYPPLDSGMESGPTGQPPVTTESGGAGDSETATRLYDSGMNYFASKSYQNAVKAFSDFVRAFPQHNLASNAQYWLGESYFQLKDYARAAIAYQDVIQKYPGSAKLQGAMLKQGQAFYYANQKDASKARLEELIKRYPSSPEAGTAKRFMQQNR